MYFNIIVCIGCFKQGKRHVCDVSNGVEKYTKWVGLTLNEGNHYQSRSQTFTPLCVGTYRMPGTCMFVLRAFKYLNILKTNKLKVRRGYRQKKKKSSKGRAMHPAAFLGGNEDIKAGAMGK